MLQIEQIQEHKTEATTTSRLIKVGLIAASFVLLLYYMVATGWGVIEFPRVLLGFVALWGPSTALISILLKSQVTDALARFTLSAIGSYTLTTLAYFGTSVLGVTSLFYVASIAVAIGVIAYAVKMRSWTKLRETKSRARNIDWILIPLIAASLVVDIRYQIAYSIAPDTGDRTFILSGDQTYYTGLVYELERHTPPLQQPTKAGVPERAYHMLPHLTTMLVAQFTGQGDALRAHIVYEYTVIEVLMCLALYCIVKILTRSRWGGYMGVALLYLFALPLPPILNNFAPYFFFTSYPYVSSSLEPVVITTPQMYSGMLVMYGIMLGVLLVSIRAYTNQKLTSLLVLLALMVGAMLRFRIQIYIPLMSVFGVLCCHGLWRTLRKMRRITKDKGRRVVDYEQRTTNDEPGEKRWAPAIGYAVAGAVAILVSALLYFEMLSPSYLENTTKLTIGNNGLTFSKNQWWLNFWPFSDAVRNVLSSIILDKETFAWAWQIISMSGFVLFNMVGIPLIIATISYLRARPAFREWRLYTWLSIWMVVASTVGGIAIGTNYDNYSVGGQMLLHTGWYLLPLMGVGVWHLFQAVRSRVSWTRRTWATVAAFAVILTLVIQQVRSPSTLQAYTQSVDVTRFSVNEWSALSYIHDSTPQDSIILSNKHLEEDRGIFGGIAGRAAYYEYTGSSLRELTASRGGQENRAERIKALWATGTSEQFCALLTSTVATHVVEYSNAPLLVHNAQCMQQLWASTAQGEKVTIWNVKREILKTPFGNNRLDGHSTLSLCTSNHLTATIKIGSAYTGLSSG